MRNLAPTIQHLFCYLSSNTGAGFSRECTTSISCRGGASETTSSQTCPWCTMLWPRGQARLPGVALDHSICLLLAISGRTAMTRSLRGHGRQVESAAPVPEQPLSTAAAPRDPESPPSWTCCPCSPKAVQVQPSPSHCALAENGSQCFFMSYL